MLLMLLLNVEEGKTTEGGENLKMQMTAQIDASTVDSKLVMSYEL